jgi:hypothetical protein
MVAHKRDKKSTQKLHPFITYYFNDFNRINFVERFRPTACNTINDNRTVALVQTNTSYNRRGQKNDTN